ncbi:MAG: DedA family protein [Minisyncoccia bacterium]
MFLSPQEALSILEQYKYLLIFPITVIEGPIITVIGGFLIYLGYLDASVAFFLLVMGDWIGDGLHYLLGRYYSKAKWFKKIGRILGYDEKREKIVEEHFKKHPGKTVLLAKISHGVGGFIQIVAGMARMDFWQFMKYSLYGALPKTFVLIMVGYYLGNSYMKIDKYMNNIAFFVIVIFLALAIYFTIKNMVDKKITEDNVI